MLLEESYWGRLEARLLTSYFVENIEWLPSYFIPLHFILFSIFFKMSTLKLFNS